MNKNEKSPEYLSLFIDDKLKKGVKGVGMNLMKITINDDGDDTGVVVVVVMIVTGYDGDVPRGLFIKIENTQIRMFPLV